MIPIQPTELPALKFTANESEREYHVQSSKIGWLHAKGERGTVFDISIKDALGREKARKSGCKIGDGDYGELVNLPVMLGEKLKVEVSNIQGPKKEVTVFLN